MNKQQYFFDQLAERWDELRAVNPAKIESLIKQIGLCEGDNVLDVGCGTGVLIPFIKKIAGDSGRITALDFSASMIAVAARKHQNLIGVRFVTGDILEFEAAAGFDKIICLNFFPHVADKPVFLNRMKRMLTPGGALIIMHDIPRTAVNAIHKSSAVVENDRLPEGVKLAELLETLDYQVAGVTDNAELYFIKAVIR